MRAIRVHEHGGPEVLRLEPAPDPEPGPGQVQIRVEAVGINFIEVYQRRGLYPVKLPATPGTECAGTVSAVGAGVEGVAPGDRVATVDGVGSYAQWTLAAADRVVRVPDGVSAAQAAAVMLQGMTAHYLACTTFPLQPGHRCLVHAAAGGVGLLLCQIAKARGARVIGTTSTPEKAERARTAGADEVILYREREFEPEVRRLTAGAGVHVVYDSVGRDTFAASLDCLAPRGLLALFGQSSGPVEPLDPQVLNRKGSLFLTRPTLAHYIATREELLARAGDVLEWVRGGRLEVRIAEEFPLERAADAHRALESRRTSGKLLLRTG